MQPTAAHKKGRSRRGLFLGLVVTALLVGGFGLWTARFVHQAGLNRQCIDAIAHQQIDRAIALFEAGADPNAPVDPELIPPFWKQFWGGSRKKKTSYKQTLFDYAVESSINNSNDAMNASSGSVHLIEVMFRHGAKIHDYRDGPESALCWAITMHRDQIAQVLITHGADVNRTESGGFFFPLGLAAQENQLKIVRLLLAHGADVNKRDRFGYSALMHACEDDRRLAIAQELLNHHAELNARGTDGMNPRYIAWVSQSHKIAALLRKYGAKE